MSHERLIREEVSEEEADAGVESIGGLLGAYLRCIENPDTRARAIAYTAISLGRVVAEQKNIGLIEDVLRLDFSHLPNHGSVEGLEILADRSAAGANLTREHVTETISRWEA